MNRYFYPSLAVLVILASAFVFAAGKWQIAEGYSVGFSSNDASGVFKSLKGTIIFDEQNPSAASFDVTVDVASLNTGNALQNKRGKSNEWFDAAKYPVIHFTSRKIVKGGIGYQATGILQMHGVNKVITVPFTFQRTAKGGQFNGSFTVNRSDYHIGKPGGDVAEKIKIDISVPVTKK